MWINIIRSRRFRHFYPKLGGKKLNYLEHFLQSRVKKRKEEIGNVLRKKSEFYRIRIILQNLSGKKWVKNINNKILWFSISTHINSIYKSIIQVCQFAITKKDRKIVKKKTVLKHERKKERKRREKKRVKVNGGLLQSFRIKTSNVAVFFNNKSFIGAISLFFFFFLLRFVSRDIYEQPQVKVKGNNIPLILIY